MSVAGSAATSSSPSHTAPAPNATPSDTQLVRAGPEPSPRVDSDSEDEWAVDPRGEAPVEVTDPFGQLQEWRDTAYGHEGDIDGEVLTLMAEIVDQVTRLKHGGLRDADEVALETLSPLERRRVVERQFPVFTVDMLAHCSYEPSASQRHEIRVHADNARQNLLSKPRLHRRNGTWTEKQKALFAADTPDKMRDLMRRRRQQVYASLAPRYLAVRVAVIQIFVAFALEVLHEWPFRTHWPEDKGEDDLFLDFVTYLSVRYTSFACVSAAFGHVIEFHMSFLGVSPPPSNFPRTRWFLKKLKLAMAKEQPEGRKRRPGLPGKFVNRALNFIRTMVDSVTPGSGMQKLYTNVGAALAFAFEQCMRVGNVCPGDAFRSDWHLSRETIKGLLQPVTSLRKHDWLVVQAPVTKTTFTSAASRERATRPRIIDTQCRKWYGTVNWGELLMAFDPLASDENAGEVPAFRVGGPHSPALSYQQACRILKLAAVDTVPAWRDFDYGGHSLRIGRVNDLRAVQAVHGCSVATEEQINGISMHTASAGRRAYDRTAVEEDLKLMRLAEDVEYTAVETVQKFPQNRGAERQIITGSLEHSADNQSLDLQAELEADTAAAEVVEDLAAIKDWHHEEPAANVLQEMEADLLGSTTEAVETTTTNQPTSDAGSQQHKRKHADANEADRPQKQQKQFDFHTFQWVAKTVVPTTAGKPATSLTVRQMRSRMCENCGLKSKNYGLVGGTKKWCGKCAKLFGGTAHCR
jgi:hypothetical protein